MYAYIIYERCVTCVIMFDLYYQISMSAMKTLIPAISMLIVLTLREATAALVLMAIVAMEKYAVSL